MNLASRMNALGIAATIAADTRAKALAKDDHGQRGRPAWADKSVPGLTGAV